ncbi:MAG: hypothetical protein KAS12_04910, partial [Candidatus Aenigmarchaeota archaeon]|nr:hypothetical protein [Candidatus Aenigmarchaeota archaeon]
AWSQRGLTITPDVSADMWAEDPRAVFEAAPTQNPSPYEQMMRQDDVFATVFYTFSMTCTPGGYVALTGGGAGSVDGITVNAIEIMSGAVVFNTDLATTKGIVDGLL